MTQNESRIATKINIVYFCMRIKYFNVELLGNLIHCQLDAYPQNKKIEK